MLIKYSANNSGGRWWLSDDDWYALERAGWDVKWKKDIPKDKKYSFMNADKNGRFLGALATDAEKEFDSVRDAIREFESVTGKEASDEGCNCCGPPHNFSWDPPDGSWGYASGEEILGYLYDRIPRNLREACDALNLDDED